MHSFLSRTARPSLWRLSLWLGCALVAANAMAQSPRPTGAADPADPRAATAPLQHRATLGTHRPTASTEPGDWRAANDAVGRIGGWRAYAREAQAPTAPTAPTAPASAVAPGARP
jgi:hypothetical protein